MSTANYADKRICAIPKVGQVVELIGTDFVNGPLTNCADKRICALPKVGQVVELIGTDFINGPLITQISELSTTNYL
ncbi:MAG: hypothetical protein B6247_13430 [Candidatus Parabeggiatoa sp. nov. 2]|nr:MAG: hypothetical protein B6247_13430 [Beggiatoa sp. 4572_84]